ncbi:BQ5605_C003g02454 [Microbotryum silenes-dioicae]|uniref:BQ5605_C003g02454 protein n=1 Tax=Microbotryum silenes-dioicae TaxID=796604 RepID=A0A2X0M574_9BASI|nr:BQ5605_C003g02454 [Microbotryum silenes-dioicae]
MLVDLGTISGDVIPLNELREWEQVLNVVVNLEECNGHLRDRGTWKGFYAQIVDILGEERGKALLSMVLHVDDFAIKTVLMEQLPEKYTFAFREEKDVDLFLEKVRTAYDEDVIMNGANDKEQTEAPASALAAARQEADPGQAPPCNGNCACGQQPHAFATAGQHRGHAGPTRNSYRSGGHGRTGTRMGAKTRAEHYANSDKWGKIVDGKFMCANNQCVNCFGFGHRRAACDSRNPTGDRIAFLQSLDVNVPVASHGTYFVEDPVPMSLANPMDDFSRSDGRGSGVDF